MNTVCLRTSKGGEGQELHSSEHTHLQEDSLAQKMLPALLLRLEGESVTILAPKLSSLGQSLLGGLLAQAQGGKLR